MTVPQDVRNGIRPMDAGGVPRAEIARRLRLSRNTVARYADMADMSPEPPVPADRPRPAIDPHIGWTDDLLEADGARLVFQVFADAYERQSAAITTNLEFSRWGGVFGDDQMAAAVIDRVVHHGRLVQFRGESYRVRHALMQDG